MPGKLLNFCFVVNKVLKVSAPILKHQQLFKLKVFPDREEILQAFLGLKDVVEYLLVLNRRLQKRVQIREILELVEHRVEHGLDLQSKFN